MFKNGIFIFSTMFLIFSCSDNLTSDSSSNFDYTYEGNYNDYGFNVALTNDGGYLVVGKTYNKTSDVDSQYDTFVQKLSSNLTLESSYALVGCSDNESADQATCEAATGTWTEINNTNNAQINDARSTDDGGFILIGSMYDPTKGWDVLLVKIHVDGTLDPDFSSDGMLTIDIGTDIGITATPDSNIPPNSDDKGISVVVNDDGSYTIAGIVHGSSVGGYDIYVASIPKNGNITIEDGTDVGIIIEGDKLAGQGINTAANDADDLDDFAAEINRTDAGGYIIAGSTRTDANGSDMWLVEVSSEIEEVATLQSDRKTFGSTTNDEYGQSAVQTSDGGYAIAGYTYSSGSGQSDFFIVKDGGTFQWEKVIGGANDDKAVSIRQTSDGGFIIAGSTYSYGNGQSDIMLVKLDEEGNEEWRQTYGGVSDDFATAVKQTSDGGYIVSGYTMGTMYDALLIKTNSLGVQ